MTDDQMVRIALTPIGVALVLWLIKKAAAKWDEIGPRFIYGIGYRLGKFWSGRNRAN